MAGNAIALIQKYATKAWDEVYDLVFCAVCWF